MILLGLQWESTLRYYTENKISLYPTSLSLQANKEYPQVTGQKAKITSRTRVADPHWINADPDSDPVLDPGLWTSDQKLEKNLKLKKIIFFWSKIGIYLSQATGEAFKPQMSKENIQQF